MTASCTKASLLTLALLMGAFGRMRAEAPPAPEAAPEVPPEGESESRVRRDGYGGGYGGGYNSGGGSYGCHCPYQYCDNNSDMLLYFSAGALLGLLFSMLQPQMMVMAAANGGRGNVRGEPEVSFFSDMPNALSQDIAPLAVDMVNVYAKSQKDPECGRRWLCEVTRASLKHGGLRARLTSLSSVAVSWFMKDMMPFMENLSDEDEEAFDCALLGPTCGGFFEQKTET